MAHIRVFPSLFPSSGLESGDVSNVPICSGPGPGRWVRGWGLGGCLQKILACPDACSLCCLALSRACLRYSAVSRRLRAGFASVEGGTRCSQQGSCLATAFHAWHLSLCLACSGRSVLNFITSAFMRSAWTRVWSKSLSVDQGLV